ncbi:MAG: sugar phosphate isomerase/epimerase family protein [Candidatus Heimdallarchaeota archaeon]
MKFGINGWCWSYPFYEEKMFRLAISKAKMLDFDGIEVPVEDPEKLDVKGLRKTLDSYGIPCSSICSVFPPDRDLITHDAPIRENCKKYIKKNIKIASELGADVVVVIPSAVGKLDTILAREDEWKLAVEGLRELGAFAADYGIYLTIEPLNRFETYFINLLPDAVKLAKDVNHPNVKVMIDTFHMNIEDDKLGEEIKMAGELIFHCHANENDRGAPGSGHIPFAEIFEALKAIQYNRWLIIETFIPGIKEIAKAASIWRPLAPDQDTLAREGLKYLRSLWSRV